MLKSTLRHGSSKDNSLYSTSGIDTGADSMNKSTSNNDPSDPKQDFSYQSQKANSASIHFNFKLDNHAEICKNIRLSHQKGFAPYSSNLSPEKV